tara:strand:+ start:1210 stop:1815 length:606 start_codon:yes stop_codon:yes gene_type:complete
MTFHDKLGRYAGGFADYIFRDATDFDGLGRGNFKKAENIDLLEREDEDDNKGKGMLDKFLAGLMSYDPEKNKTESDEFLDSMASRGFASGSGSGSFQNIGGGVTMFTPSNAARNQAIAMQNQQNMIAAQQKKEQKSNVGRMAGSALGTAIAGPVGGFIGGALGGLFCDIRLKEDIAPLCESEVNDVLSECAFFVKDLNECS